jgi:hypothetical protein
LGGKGGATKLMGRLGRLVLFVRFNGHPEGRRWGRRGLGGASTVAVESLSGTATLRGCRARPWRPRTRGRSPLGQGDRCATEKIMEGGM